MSLRQAFVGSRIIETAQNYERADTPLLTKPEKRAGDRPSYADYYDDEAFWARVLADPERVWGWLFHFHAAAVSEWIARVPGLYWKPESRRWRRLGSEAVEHRSDAWVTYRPWGKSQKVMGGIGTLRLPPARDGYRLATLTTTCNASAGVPVLISPEVWEHHRLQEGMILRGQARWQPMDQGWSSYFPSTRNIPRGYLILDDPAIEVHPDQRAPTLIQPFTVMEYYSGPTELFDYVFAGRDTGAANYRQELERFFDSYKDKNERYGRYLLSGDMVSPLWDARFNSPEDLRHADPAADSQLAILEARVRERHLGEEVCEQLLKVLSSVCNSADQVKQFSDEAGIPPAIWFTGGTVAEASSQLVAAALDRGKVAALVEAVATHYPEKF